MDDGRRSLTATSAAHFINDGLSGVLPLMYPLFVATYGISLQTISIITFLQSAFSIIVSPLVGGVSDARGNFAGMIPLGLVLFAVGTEGYAVSGLFFQGTLLVIILLVFTVFVGVGSSFYHPLGATVLRAKWPASNLGSALGINGSAGGLGRLAMPFAAAFLIAAYPLSSISLLAGIAVAGALAIFAILRKVEFTGHRVQNGGTVLRQMLPNRKLFRRLSALTTVSFARGLFTGVLPFIPLYLTQVDHYSNLQAGFLFSVTLGVGVLSTILFGFIQDRLGARFSLGLSNLGGLAALFLFTVSTNGVVIDASLVLFGIFSYSAFSLLLGVVQNLTSFDEMTSASSIVWGIGNGGGSAGTPLLIFGALALPSGYGTLTTGFLAAAVVGILSIALLPLVRTSESKNR